MATAKNQHAFNIQAAYIIMVGLRTPPSMSLDDEYDDDDDDDDGPLPKGFYASWG